MFCVEHRSRFTNWNNRTAEHSVPTNPKMRDACKVAYFGWYEKYGDYVIDGGTMAESMNERKMDYVFTQQMIWEVLGQSNAKFKDSSIKKTMFLLRQK